MICSFCSRSVLETSADMHANCFAELNRINKCHYCAAPLDLSDWRAYFPVGARNYCNQSCADADCE